MVLDHARIDDLDLIGRIIAGGLRIVERTGLSPQGPLYEAEGPDGRRVVLLILPGQAPWQEPAGVRSLRFASRIRHPNVAGVYGLGNLEDGSTYVILEQVVGDPLPEILNGMTALPIGEALDLTVQIAAGLEALHHGGLVHGSVSPGAVVVTRPPFGKSQVKLVGFSLDSEGQRQISVEDGTADYASPERLAGSPPDVRGDVFSAGGLLHYLLSGEPPPREPPVGDVPRIARPVLERALAPQTSARFRTMTEFREAVEALASAAVTSPDTLAARKILGRALAVGLVLLASGVLLAPIWRSVAIGRGPTSAVPPPSAPAPSAAPADSAATAVAAPVAQVPEVVPRRSTEAGKTPTETRARPRTPERPPGGPGRDPPTETGDEAAEALGYVGQPSSSDPPPPVETAPTSPQAGPAPVVAPRPPPGKPARPLTELEEEPPLRLAIGDVMRVGLAEGVVETRFGLLVLHLAPDGLSVPSASYNLQRLFLAYSAATDEPDTLALELRQNGQVVGWFTREGLRLANPDGGGR